SSNGNKHCFLVRRDNYCLNFDDFDPVYFQNHSSEEDLFLQIGFLPFFLHDPSNIFVYLLQRFNEDQITGKRKSTFGLLTMKMCYKHIRDHLNGHHSERLIVCTTLNNGASIICYQPPPS
ncbi:hypothetical protein L9F63_018079, partial [Diploptera punctata]